MSDISIRKRQIKETSMKASFTETSSGNKAILALTAISFFIAILCGCKKEQQQPEDEPTVSIPTSVEAKGDLTTSGNNGPFIFRTNGGGTITIQLTGSTQSIIINHDSFPLFKLEFWGVDDFDILCGNHENINGKHIKARLNTRRTIVFPDGAKITMSSGPGTYYEPLVTISIYDLEESHRINATTRTLVHSSTDAIIAQQYDEAEADGEAGGFVFTETGLLVFNDYMEDTPGNIILDHYDLGEIYFDIPNTVTDYYDDPRFGHT
jgi:hypothetical protein